MNPIQKTNRLKIKTHLPLTPFQAWIPFNPEQSIQSLKNSILKLIQSSQQPINPISIQDIILELDDFAFLDQSPCSLIDPIHDLIDVKVAAPADLNTPTKRRRSQSKTDPKTDQGTSQLENKPMGQIIQDNINTFNQVKIKSQPSHPQRPIKPLPASNLNQNKTTRPAPKPPGEGKRSTKLRNQRKRLKKIQSRQLDKPKQPHSDQNSTHTLNHNSGNPTVVPKPQVSNPPSDQQALQTSNSTGTQQASSNRSITQKSHENESQSDVSSSSSESQSDVSSSSSESQSYSSESHSGSSSSESESQSDSSSSKPHNPSSSKPQAIPLSKSASSPLSSSPSSSSSSSKPQSSFSSLKKSQSESASSTLSSQPEKTIEPSKSQAPIVQKIVPIIHNPLLTMLSLSNKNKRKNVKRKLCLDQLNQPSKIVFGSPCSARHRRSSSPCFVPPSPICSTQLQSSPILQQINPNESVENDLSSRMLANNENFDDSVMTTSGFPTHGPPPSVRDPRLIPPNIIITSVNVLNPYWTPGQIGKQQNWVTHENSEFHSHYAPGKRTNNKRKRKNRKKGLKKRRRMAAKSQMSGHDKIGECNVDEKYQSDDYDNDEEDEDEEIQKEVEEAYQDFINSGGHSRPTDVVNHLTENSQVREIKESTVDSDGVIFKKNLSENWNQFIKIDFQSAVAGSKIAIRTWEISVESFTPELVIYYGKIIDSNEMTLSMKLDAECIPKSATIKSESEKNQNESDNDDDGKYDDYPQNDDDDGENEERQVDVKEAIRKTHREALIHHLCGHSSFDTRHWDWNNIVDAREI